MDDPTAVWLAFLLGGAFVWLILCDVAFSGLRARHRAIYESIGSPSVFRNHSFAHAYGFLRFLLGGHYRELKDTVMVRLFAGMRIYFYAYLLFIIVFFAVVVLAPKGYAA